MKKTAILLVLMIGMSFAVTAEDFPCISKPSERNECWVKFRDPRDSQVYLAIKQCRVRLLYDKSEQVKDSCSIRVVENSRFKSTDANCDKSKGRYYHGCTYPNDGSEYKIEVETSACPDLGVERGGCNGEWLVSPTYFVKNKEYAELREKIFSGKDVTIQGNVMVMENSLNTAAPCGAYISREDTSSRWGIFYPLMKKIYWRCSYRMSE